MGADGVAQNDPKNNGQTGKSPETVPFEDVLASEHKRIDSTKKKQDYIGLALSGGGIRSASFGLGVIQALYSADMLKEIDYLSTVSGGGYIGSSLTWFLQMGIPKECDKSKKKKGCSFGQTIAADTVQSSPDDAEESFPFGRIGAGGQTEQKKHNAILDYIRQHGNYIMPGKGLDAFYLFGVVFRSMIISLVIYLMLLTTVVSALHLSTVFKPVTANFRVVGEVTLNYPLMFAGILVVLLAVGALVYSVLTFLYCLCRKSVYQTLVFGQTFLSCAWKLVVIFLLLGSLPQVYDRLQCGWQYITAGSLNAVGILAAVLEYKKMFSATSSKSKLSGIIAVVGSCALLYGLLLLSYVLAKELFNTWWYFAVLAAVFFVLGVLVNLNYVGFARVYRDRLMETFLPNDTNVLSNEWGLASIADKALLKDMCEKHPRPYHLINTNAVLVNSPRNKYRQRGGDSFLLSPLYCGSSATGWVKTESYMTRGWFNRGMTLPTAMAISGAAVNPNAGVSGRGLTRNRFVSLLMELVNLRLGYWAYNPSKKISWLPPNFLSRSIKANILGMGFSEERGPLELSDGGHFENLGLYELIRRKCKMIFVSDAAVDAEFQFGDLANAVERVRVDFGAKIRFDEDFGLEGLLPGSLKSPLAKKYQLSERAFAIANILYDDKTEGRLFYIKTTLTPGLPPDIYGYKSDNETFPDQSTADQFFDERQFEAYRELGYQLTRQMIQSGAFSQDTPGKDAQNGSEGD